MKNTLSRCLKGKVYNERIMPAMMYGCKTEIKKITWKQTPKKLQASMEKEILGITRQKKGSTWIRE